MKIYVSGPITGYSDKNKPAFDLLSTQLRNLGYEVVNPFDLDFPGFNPEECWFKYLKRDLAKAIFCDAVCLLPGWEESKGAKLEVLVAQELNIPLFTLRNNKLVPEYVAIDIEMVPLIPSHLWQE